MSFGNLMLAEYSRLRYRNRFSMAVLSALIMGFVGPPLWMGGTAPLTADDYAAAAQEYELSREACTDCTVETFLRPVLTFHEAVYIGIAPWLIILAVLVLLLVLVYASADFASGAITTQLTFTPNRLQLLSARVLTSGVLGAILMGVAAVASAAVTIVWYVALHGYDSLPSNSGLLATMLAAILLGFFVGVITALVVFVFHGGTIAAALLAAILLACLLLEAIAYDVNLPHWLFQMMPTRHAESLVVGSAYQAYEQVPLHASEALTRQGSLGYFAGLVAVAGVLAGILFQRRDVKN